MRNKERMGMDGYAAYQNRIVDALIVDCVKELKEMCPIKVYDLNETIKLSKESLFTSYWIHCNARGNAIIANKTLEVLRQEGLIS